MPHRTRAWIWAGRAAAAVAVIGLAGYLAAVGLDEAGRLAAPVGLVIALAALFAPYLLPAFQPPVPPPVPLVGPAPARMIIATDGSVAAERIDHLDYHQAPPRGVSWPVLVGQVPALASVFQDRAGLREQLDAARSAGGSVARCCLAAGGSASPSWPPVTPAARWPRALTWWSGLMPAPGAVIEVFARAAARVQAPG